MTELLTAEEMRAADRAAIAAGTSEEELVRRAGKALADEIEKEWRSAGGGSVLIACGSGNNGADGYVAARILAERGVSVKVLAVLPPLSPCASAEARNFSGEVASDFDAQPAFSVAADCIFGTGLSRPAEGAARRAIEYLNRSGRRIVACDLPSGLDATSGAALGETVRADVTVCMGRYKAGLFLADGLDCAGRVVLADIGIPALSCAAMLADEEYVAAAFPARKRNSHKGTYGRAAIVGGSRAYSGAPILAGRGLTALLAAEGAAALRTGAGYSWLAVPEGVFDPLAGQVPECVLTALPGREQMEFSESAFSPLLSANAVAFGMGAGRGEGVRRALEFFLGNYEGNLIVDADGLNALASLGADAVRRAKCRVALTPHPGEFSRLTGKPISGIARDPIGAAREYAAASGAAVALKGASTVVTDGTRAVLSARGSSALAKGGSGDTLSGIAAGIAARTDDLVLALSAASYLLGRSAEIVGEEMGEYSPVASDVVRALPRAVKELEDRGKQV